MSSIRRAFLFASAERYVVILINFAMVPVIARLMGPAEFGISVLGMAALAIAESVRDFGGTAYIIQEKDLTEERVRTAFTITLLWTLFLTGTLFFVAGPLAEFYNVPGLKLYLEIIALSYLIGPFVTPLFALMQREMRFGELALITITTTIINAGTTIVLASLGYSYLSFALANVVSASCGMMMGFYMRPQFSIFSLSLSGWRSLIQFGRYQTGVKIIASLGTYAPFLILGRLLDNTAIGLYQRAVTVSRLPMRAVSAIDAIAFPAISEHLRNGGDVARPFLHAVRLITGVTLPSLLVLAVLAEPVVRILLGPNWMAVAPLVSIICVGLAWNFAASLTESSVLAAGGVKQLFWLYLVVVPVSTGVMTVTAFYGIEAVAWSMWATGPFELVASIYLIRQFATFSVIDLVKAVRPSAAVALLAVAGPVLVIALNGWEVNLPLASTGAAVLLAAIGWLSGLWLTEHPIFEELRRALHAGRRRLGWDGRSAALP